jgi:hypothetical protein
MKRVLFVGQEPETVDYSDPALPPGLDAPQIQAGIEVGLAKIEEHGWQAEPCMIAPDSSGIRILEQRLADSHYDCVVIGGGIRLPPKSTRLLELVVNAVRKTSPDTPIAFNTVPEDTAEAAARWVTD